MIIGSAEVEIKPNTSRFPGDTAQQLRDSKGKFVAAGEPAGEALGEGITRGADGKLRDSKGKFVAMGEAGGDAAGDGFGRGFNKRLSKIKPDLSSLNKVAQGFRDLDVLGSKLQGLLTAPFAPAKVGAFATALVGAVGGVTALAGGGIALAASLSQALGVALALPGAFAAVKIATAAVKFAVAGTEDTVKALTGAFTGDKEAAAGFAATIKNLSPAAQTAARGAFALRGEINTLRLGMQQSLFAPFAGTIRELGARLIPAVSAPLRGLTADIGAATGHILSFLNNRDSLATVGSIFTNVRSAFSPILEVAPTIFQNLLDLTNVSTKFAGVIGQDVADALDTVTGKLGHAAREGSLQKTFTDGYNAAKQFGGALVDVVATIGNVFRAALPLGGALLGNLGKLTGALREFTGSTQGQAKLSEFFTSLAPLLHVIGAIVGQVVTGLGALIPVAVQVATVLGAGIADALVALQPGLQAFGRIVLAIAPTLAHVAVIIGETLSQALIALAPAIPPIAEAFGQIARILGQSLVVVIRGLAPYLPTLAAGFLGLVQAAAPLIPLIVNFLSSFQVGAPILQAIAGIFTALLPAAQALFPALGQIVTILGQTLADNIVILTPAIAALGQAFADMAPSLVDIFGSLARLLGLFARLISDVLVAIAPLLPDIVEAFAKMAHTLVDALEPVLPDITKLLVELIKAALPLIPAMLELVLAVLPLVPPLLQLAVAILPALIPLIQLTATVVQFFADHTVLLGIALAGLALLIGGPVGAIIAIGLFAAAIIAMLPTLARWIDEMESHLPQSMQTFLTVVANAQTIVSGAFRRIGDDGVALVPIIQVAMGRAGNAVTGFGRDALGAAGIGKKAFDDLAKSFQNLATVMGAAGARAGAAFAGGLAASLDAGLAGAVAAMERRMDDLKAFLPSSPVRRGPLTILNNGRAGRAIARMIADGMTDGLPDINAAAAGLAAAAATATQTGGRGTAGQPVVTRMDPDDLAAMLRALASSQGSVFLDRARVGTVLAQDLAPRHNRTEVLR